MKSSNLKTIRLFVIIILNGIFIILVFFIAEIGYRLYKDGFLGMLTNLTKYWDTPYSNLDSNSLFIYDKELAYKFNPKMPGINELSIRHSDFIIKKPQGVYRIICIGDSLLYSFKGKVYKNYKSEDATNKITVEVINAAVPGYTTYQELIFLKKYLLQTSPDLVILNYCLNDNHKFLHRFEENMVWTAEAEESLKINNIFDKIVSRSYMLSKIKLFFISKKITGSKSKFQWENRTDINTAWKDYSWVNMAAYLKEMKQLLNQRGIRLCIVVFPVKFQFDQKLLDSHYDYVLKPQRKMKYICDKYKIPMLDLFPYFYDAYLKRVELFEPDGLHLNKGIFKLIEEKILSFLDRIGYLPYNIKGGEEPKEKML